MDVFWDKIVELLVLRGFISKWIKLNFFHTIDFKEQKNRKHKVHQKGSALRERITDFVIYKF